MGSKLRLGIGVIVVIALIAFAVSFVRDAVRACYASHCYGLHVTPIWLALAEYHQQYGSYPPAYVLGKDGKPAHSWRVLILPYLGEGKLYKRYDFDEPWDGPHNRLLVDEMPHNYQCPAAERDGPFTNFVVVVGPETLWPGAMGVSRKDVTCEMAAVLFVEIADSDINWMEPRDLTLAEASLGVNKDRRRGISSNHEGGAFCGTLVVPGEFLPNDTSPEVLRARLTLRGGESLKSSCKSNGRVEWVLKTESEMATEEHVEDPERRESRKKGHH